MNPVKFINEILFKIEIKKAKSGDGRIVSLRAYLSLRFNILLNFQIKKIHEFFDELAVDC